MRYNPDIHHRRSIRLKGYDYSRAGLYFVTICCDGQKHRFGSIEDGEMMMNEYGTIAYNEWWNLAERFESVDMDVFQIMPNHIHGIIAIGAGAPIGAGVGAPLAGAPGADIAGAPGADIAGAPGADIAGAPGADIGAGASPAPTADLGDIVGAYKSLVANGCLKIYKSNGQIVATQLLGTYCPQRTGIISHPSIHRKQSREMGI